MYGRRWLVVLLSAALGVGAALGAGACGEDRGSVDVEGDSTGKKGGTNTGNKGGTNTGNKGGTNTGSQTSTGEATVDTGATDPKALDAAMAAVKDYARKRTSGLVSSTERLQRAVDAGNVSAAKKAYASGRPYYERIEPLVALFPELDGKIDAREDAFPKKAADPKWTGFHPIERDLWKKGKVSAATEKQAAGLVRDSKRLNALMARASVRPEVVIPGTAELIDEIEESKITGDEERYSKLDLPTFVANLEGAKAFYETLEALVEAKDRSLHTQIEEAFDDAFAEVRKLRRGGRFISYDALSGAQQRELKQSIEALAEPLARVQGVLGVRK